MSDQSKHVLLPVIFLLISILSSLCSNVSPIDAAESAGSNPAYAKYDFGDRQRVVTFSSQPLGVLAAVIPEVMRRDRILNSYLQARQMELKVLPFYNGPDINHFMRQGKIDIAMAGDFPTLNMASTADVQVIAISKRDKAAVVTHRKYNTMKDLVGKRIAFPQGTSSHLGLLVVLESSGIKESDVQMIPMDINLLTTAIVEGRIDAFAGWEPVPTTALAANKDLKIISQFLNTDFLYWTGDFARQKPEVSRQIFAAYVRAINWMKESDAHLTRAAKWSLSNTDTFFGKPSTLSLAQFKQRIRENLNLVGSSAIPADEFARGSYLNRAFELLKKKELLPKEARWEKVQESLQPALVKEVLTAPAKYKTTKFEYPAE